MAGFNQALPFVLRMEGGDVNDPDDRGGATSRGVTQANYDAWRVAHGQAKRPVKEMSDGEVRLIYHSEYWVAAKCDAVPWPLSLGHFDAAVNHGVANAWRIMQRALGVPDDGKPGPVTFAALEMAGDGIVWDWLKARAGFYARIVQGSPTQAKFLRGWLNRVFDLHREMEALG